MKTNKKKLALAMCAVISATTLLTSNVSATDYIFEEEPYNFGRSTSTDAPIGKDDSKKNIRRNKDVTDFPPEYGVFGGTLPTSQTSPYHEKQTEEENYSVFPFDAGEFPSATPSSQSAGTGGDGFLASTSENKINSSSKIEVNYFGARESDTAKVEKVAEYTEPYYWSDNRIGQLTVPRFDKIIDIYQGTTVENMRKGLGHFTDTSAWDGNVGLAGHNRGNYAYFSFLKDMKKGDEVTYHTGYGKRTYKVTGIYTIDVTNTNVLNWSSKNQLTMITCVADKPNLRLCVVATEVK